MRRPSPEPNVVRLDDYRAKYADDDRRAHVRDALRALIEEPPDTAPVALVSVSIDARGDIQKVVSMVETSDVQPLVEALHDLCDRLVAFADQVQYGALKILIAGQVLLPSVVDLTPLV